MRLSLQSTRTNCIGLVACLLLASKISVPVLADDASRGVSLPPLRAVPSGSVQVRSTSITLDDEAVAVRLSVDVVDEKGTSLKLTLPRFGWMGEAEPYPDRDFPELKVLLDGKPAAVGETFRAFMGQNEITRILEQDKINPFVISDTPPFLTWAAGATHSVEGLQGTGAIEKADDRYVAKWEAQRILSIALSKGTHEIAMQYKPRPAYRLLSVSEISHSEQLAQACLSGPELRVSLGQAHTATIREYTLPVSIVEASPSMVEARIDLSRSEDGTPDLTAFCGTEGKAAASTNGQVSAAARPDAAGRLHVLAIKKTSR